MKDEQKTRELLRTKMSDLHRRTAEFEVPSAESKPAENWLQDSEAKSRALVEQIPNAAIQTASLDERSTTPYVSHRIEDILGCSKEECKTHPDIWAQSIHPDDYSRVIEEANRCRETGEPFISEYRMIRKDGNLVWVHEVGNIVRNNDGAPLCVLGVHTDITNRKQAEELLRIQCDLGIALGSMSELIEILDRVLLASFHIEGIDCGGVYLVDELTGALDLVAHKGLPLQFVLNASHFDADSPQAQLVVKGNSIYGLYSDMSTNSAEACKRERLRALAIIPIKYEGQVVAVLNLSSHTHDEIPIRARESLDAIAAQIGGVIARVRAEEALRKSQRGLESLFTTVDDFLFILDSEGRILKVNPMVEKRLGYSAEKLSGQSVAKVHPPEHREEAARIISDMLVGKESVCPIPLLTKDGKLISVETRVTRGEWEGENVLFGVSRDITVHKRAEEELETYRLHLQDLVKERTVELGETNEKLVREIEERKQVEKQLRISEEKFRELAELLPETVFEIDAEGNITFVNRKAFEHFRYTQQDFDQGLNAFDMIVPEDRPRAMQNIQRVLMGEDIGINEYTALRKDGTAFPALIHSAAIFREDKLAGLRGFIIDMTKMKHLESQLRHAQRLEAVGTLAGGVAHDFNNLLQAVRGYAQLLLLNKDSKEPDCGDLNEIMRAADRGAELTRQLLTFSRKINSVKRPLLLNHEVAAAKKLLERTIPKMIEIETQLLDDSKLVSADPVQIEQVIVNLALNSADAMPEGGKLIIASEMITLDETYCQTHTALRPGDYMVLEVSDTGHGMDLKSLENVFDPFYTTKEVGKGTGLGLAVVYGIVKDHEGHIICHTKAGAGTTFKIYLPVIERGARVTEVSESESPILRGTETVLLVDDERAVLDLGERTLTKFGYTVMTACSGEKALELYRQKEEQIDLVILDLIMPGMGGSKCLEELLQLNPHAQVLIASGYSSKAATKEALKETTSGFIAKPYDIKRMLESVRAALD